MDFEGFKQQFANAKSPMPLNQSADFIRRMQDDYPMLSKSWTFNRLEYNHRLAVRTACAELENLIRNAAPWVDYREIIAECIWPYMRRIFNHEKDGRYDRLDGTYWGIADAWFVEMWLAYDEIFHRMPGTIPDIASWRMLDILLNQTERSTRSYRRKL